MAPFQLDIVGSQLERFQAKIVEKRGYALYSALDEAVRLPIGFT